MKSYEIRQMWLDFFKEKQHEVLSSASLIPQNDKTLLWINAGVAPLKKYFDGREVPKNKRMVNAQKSIRTNDIDNVGKTARHHTFFEMLGNFSIGDYFRKEALTYAIEILTSPKWFNFDLNKLYFTIYPDDVESFDIWVSLGVNPTHIIKLEDNFWEIGEGPCGPDTEIFYDRGEEYDPFNLGIKLLTDGIENDRYIEIWNIVFSQYNAAIGVSRSEYKELPSKNIDTGMGLERMACIIQGVETNYETDLFMPIIEKLSEITNVKYEKQMAFKVIVDHIRSITFALSDGAMLSNEGRGYVLRRILRRAVRYGKKLGMNEPFLYKLVNEVVLIMEPFYPYLKEHQNLVSEVIKTEEEKFLQTLEKGEKKLLDYLDKSNVVTKEFAFLLYDTFGFPIELTIEVASEYNASVDLDGFKEELLKQKELARSARSEVNSMASQNEDMLNFHEESVFIGYETLCTTATVKGIFSEGELVTRATGEVILVFDKTPFYATSGGQVGDLGTVTFKNKTYQITDSFKLPNNQHGISVVIEDSITTNSSVYLEVDQNKRKQISKNHSATHLLNESLRKVLGTHVIQQGSLVNFDGLRFDFNHYVNLSNEQIYEIESLVKNEINKNSLVDIKQMPLDEALKLGVQALFNEKYSDLVRVCKIGFSLELCGGTHVVSTNEINDFMITSIENKGSGIFRIEAITGNKIEASKIIEPILNELIQISQAMNKEYKLKPNYLNSYQTIVEAKLELKALKEELKKFNKEQQKQSLKSFDVLDYVNNIEVINGFKTLIFKTNVSNISMLKDAVDRISDKIGDSIVLGINESTLSFVCKSKIDKINASTLIKEVCKITSGSGGGRADFAQGGGKDITKLDDAINFALSYLKNNL